MNAWSKWIGGTLLMAPLWVLAWAPLGPLLGLIVDPDGSMDEPWIAVALFPGFLSGAVFSLFIWRASRWDRFLRCSVPESSPSAPSLVSWWVCFRSCWVAPVVAAPISCDSH